MFKQYYFEKRTIKEQKKEILTFMLNYEYFLNNFPIKFRDECEDYNMIHKTNFYKINFIPLYGGITKNIYENKNDLNYKAYLLNKYKYLPITGEQIPDPDNLISLIHKPTNSNTDSNADLSINF